MTADELKAIRKALGLSARKLGEAIGVTDRAIRYYEAGRPIPRPVELAIRSYAQDRRRPT